MDADFALECLSLGNAAESAAEVLHNDALLARIFCHADDLDTLLHSSSVCKLWRSVLDSDDIWRAVYLTLLPEPLEFERVSNYRQQFQRLHGLQRVPPPQQTALKGSALCYNAATRSLVSFNSRQRMVSVQQRDGSIRSEITDVQGAATAHKPLLASTSSELVVLAAFDGPLQLWDAATCQP
ncbi:hypothetical protein COO60DRAFT_1116291 [Scenedesmus sp. NREL 46B-D3]|nr:hypothetical protein COO60DRAFT_1116291 [Scenedesmus sp. NREL 46B-D3]